MTFLKYLEKNIPFKFSPDSNLPLFFYPEILDNVSLSVSRSKNFSLFGVLADTGQFFMSGNYKTRSPGRTLSYDFYFFVIFPIYGEILKTNCRAMNFADM